MFLLSIGYSAVRKYEDPFHRFSPPHLQTASTPNCSSIPHHNSAPPLPRLISLHAHSVAAIHSFLYNISHTPGEISHALPCSNNGKVVATKEMANKANLTSKIRKCSHWRDDLISCYTPVSFQNAPLVFPLLWYTVRIGIK